MENEDEILQYRMRINFMKFHILQSFLQLVLYRIKILSGNRVQQLQMKGHLIHIQLLKRVMLLALNQTSLTHIKPSLM